MKDKPLYQLLIRCILLINLIFLHIPFVRADNVSENSTKPFIIMELFTSEGCSSCPPADKIFARILEQAKENNLAIYGLGFHVDYWDNLGWKDPFANPIFTHRQRYYAKMFNSNSLYTPQLIMNGKEAFGGYRVDLIQNFIDNALMNPPDFSMTITSRIAKNHKIHVNYSINKPFDRAILTIALLQNLGVSHVTRGENSGKTLHHRNIVLSLHPHSITKTKGEISFSYPHDLDIEELSIVAILQKPQNMHILAADGLSLNRSKNLSLKKIK